MRNEFLKWPSAAMAVQRLMALFPLKAEEGFFTLELELARQYDELTKARVMARNALLAAEDACHQALTQRVRCSDARWDELKQARAEAESIERELNLKAKAVMDKLADLQKEQELVLKQESGSLEQAA